MRGRTEAHAETAGDSLEKRGPPHGERKGRPVYVDTQITTGTLASRMSGGQAQQFGPTTALRGPSPSCKGFVRLPLGGASQRGQWAVTLSRECPQGSIKAPTSSGQGNPPPKMDGNRCPAWRSLTATPQLTPQKSRWRQARDRLQRKDLPPGRLGPWQTPANRPSLPHQTTFPQEKNEMHNE